MLIRGDARFLPLQDGCVDCVVSSPPYWALRDYGCSGQIGLEKAVGEYVSALLKVFREVYRVLKPSGTCWLNLGDSYAGGGNYRGINSENTLTAKLRSNRGATGVSQSLGALGKDADGAKPKDLVGIPWRVAFALQADGWYLRSDIIWSKPNPMPESVTDRPTKAHEYLFLLAKQERYYYDAAAIAEPVSSAMLQEMAQGYGGLGLKDYEGAGVQNPSSVKARIIERARVKFGSSRDDGQQPHSFHLGKGWQTDGVTRNRRTVWSVPTMPYSGAHFATMPEKLIEPCILAGCPLYVCAKCGAAVDLDNANTKVPIVQSGVSDIRIAERPQQVLQQSMRVCGEAEGSSELSGVPETNSVPEGLTRESILLESVCEQRHGQDSHDDEGLRHHHGEGLQGDLCADASDGLAGRVCDGASAGDVEDCRPESAAVRGGASQERTEAGQQAREPRVVIEADTRSIAEAEASASYQVSIVLGRDLSIPCCPRCGVELINANVRPGLVLDPFVGSGTVVSVAERLGRRGVGVDLSYQDLAKKRTAQRGLRF